jgi:membrane protease YdiL (CAAX protease family)
MIRILMRHKPVASGRNNLILIAILLVLPIAISLWMGKLSLVIVSTIFWQFFLSGFGEEFLYRGYFQGRISQAFGRPYQLFGFQFGSGLFVAALLFGLMHAFNGYQPGLGLRSMYWGWALWTFFGGLFGGIIREKTGTLLAPGITHGLPDAVGEPLRILMGWG